MLKIRLMRIGAKGKPFYRVVVVDERNKRTGGYIELLGTYNPLTNPKEIKLKKDRIEHWTKMGAQPSDGYLRITGKAPQRLPRKPKKEKSGQGTGDSGQIKEDKEPKTQTETSEKSAKSVTQSESSETPASPDSETPSTEEVVEAVPEAETKSVESKEK